MPGSRARPRGRRPRRGGAPACAGRARLPSGRCAARPPGETPADGGWRPRAVRAPDRRAGPGNRRGRPPPIAPRGRRPPPAPDASGSARERRAKASAATTRAGPRPHSSISASRLSSCPRPCTHSSNTTGRSSPASASSSARWSAVARRPFSRSSGAVRSTTSPRPTTSRLTTAWGPCAKIAWACSAAPPDTCGTACAGSRVITPGHTGKTLRTGPPRAGDTISRDP